MLLSPICVKARKKENMASTDTEKDEIAAIEADLKRWKISADAFQTKADVSSSTWARIKNGELPSGTTMRKIRSAHEKQKTKAGE